MSFCPHCGKSVAEAATKCIACGGELQPRGKGARFKGTMMMQPGQAPAAPLAPAPAPAVAKPAPAPVQPAAVEPARAILAAAPSKAKHTMIGTGGLAGLGLGIAPPPGMTKPAIASVPPGAPPPAAGPSSLPPAPPPAPDPALADTGRERQLAVPPMAAARAEEPRSTARLPSALHLDEESDPPPPQFVPGRKGGPIIALILGGAMLLIAVVYFISRMLNHAS